MANHDYIMEENVECRLSDGVTLMADIYRPNDTGRYPVLMIRLPYDKKTPRYFNEYLDVPRMVAAGYVVILQDVRGRFSSEGEFYPFIHEGDDGYESVEWAASLSYSNGKVGLFGMSYHGYTQLAAACSHPPSLKAIAPVMTLSDPFKDMVKGDGGVSKIANLYTWTMGSILEGQLKRKGNPNYKSVPSYIEQLPELLRHRPLIEAPPIQALDPNSFFFDMVHEELSDTFLDRIDVSKDLAHVNIPALFIGGWFDSLLKPTLNAYHAYDGPRMLWIGPWTHEEMTGRAGEKFFDNAAKNIGEDAISDPTELHIKWFDKWLKDEPLPITKPVQLYMTQQDGWEAFEAWPPETNVRSLYLAASVGEGTNDGYLPTQQPQKLSIDHLKLDPENPVPAKGGGALTAGQKSGMFDVSEIQKRGDVLVYTSDVLEGELDVVGTIKAKIWVSSSTPLMDLFIRVTDVEPDGAAYNVADTFYRETAAAKDEPFCIELDINHTSYRFRKRHRLRVDIAASNAPTYDVNLNNGKTSLMGTSGEVAFEKIYCGGDYPSKLMLPIKI